MAKYVLHDAIAEGCFNRSWCSAGGPLSSWANELTNSPAILSLLCERMQSDYESVMYKSRKSYNFASVDTCFNSSISTPRVALNQSKKFGQSAVQPAQEQLQRRCGAFQACLEAFRSKYPSAFTSAEETNIIKALLVFRIVLVVRLLSVVISQLAWQLLSRDSFSAMRTQSCRRCWSRRFHLWI